MNSPNNRLAAAFAKTGSRAALIPYITSGEPSMQATPPLMHALVKAGADIIELGVPFSDPMADGPVIQRAGQRAIERGRSEERRVRKECRARGARGHWKKKGGQR